MKKINELVEILSRLIGRPLRVICMYGKYQIVAPVGDYGGFMPVSVLLSRAEVVMSLQTAITLQTMLMNTAE